MRVGTSGRIDLFPVPDGSDDEVTKIDAAGRATAPPRSAGAAVVFARTNDGASPEASVPVRPQARDAFASISDEMTSEYDIGEAPTHFDGNLDGDEDETRDAEASEAALSPPGETVRAAILPRTRDDFVRSRPAARHVSGPRFETRGKLGVGSGGDVSLEFDRDIERTVAVKRLRSDDPETVLRFAEEVRTIGGMEHPNIVPIHDVGVDDAERYYFVMKYVDGETLEKVIRQLAAGDPHYQQRYTIERRAEICMEVMYALSYAHARGIIHRDIKPANIMVGKYGEVMLMDWGVAKRLRGGAGPDSRASADAALRPEEAGPATEQERLFKTTMGAIVGTPYYMSPEQANSDHDMVDARSDVYGLSVVMHELFTLRHYLSDRTTLLAVIEGINEADRPFALFVQDIYQAALPCEMMHFVRKGMRKHPAERFQSMAEMIEAFRIARSGRFAVQCYFTLMKRSAYGISHLVDNHPVLVTIAFVVTVIGIPSLLTLAVLHNL